jgi:hypothetical protein
MEFGDYRDMPALANELLEVSKILKIDRLGDLAI